MTRLGLYVHIPFCRSRCLYCDFTSSTGMEALIPSYRDALMQELQRELTVRGGEPITTVFFGGGTPTLWDAELLISVLEPLAGRGRLASTAEVTIEANPGTVDRSKLTRLREAGFNRLSLGVQSSDDAVLNRLGRAHSCAEAESAFYAGRAAGFDNINMDLIFGIPDQTPVDWERTLRWATAMGPEHLSCYGLQLEEGTPMAEAVLAGELMLPSEDEMLAMMKLTREFLPNYGLFPYEISNYALPGRECRHNIQYWTAGDYIGIGAGAYSTRGMLRWANTDSIPDYIGALEGRGVPLREEEILTQRQKMAEEIMLGLRMTKGVDWSEFWQRWGGKERQMVEVAMQHLVEEGWLCREGDMLRLTERAISISNAVIGRLCEELL